MRAAANELALLSFSQPESTGQSGSCSLRAMRVLLLIAIAVVGCSPRAGKESTAPAPEAAQSASPDSAAESVIALYQREKPGASAEALAESRLALRIWFHGIRAVDPDGWACVAPCVTRMSQAKEIDRCLSSCKTSSGSDSLVSSPTSDLKTPDALCARLVDLPGTEPSTRGERGRRCRIWTNGLQIADPAAWACYQPCAKRAVSNTDRIECVKACKAPMLVVADMIDDQAGSVGGINGTAK